ncbi:MAG: formylglycine-generating enzyme family protein [Rhodothermales bacterium]|nr:formylglycine-generating enzyme family protein [Rhodothermales bacterium]MBO6779781.1 formylglycine-generating enzyme family protein [Rhodothermales bacterium]
MRLLLIVALVLIGCGEPAAPPEGMVAIPGGTFLMGSDTGRPDELPPHEVTVSDFWMDSTEVTNARFARFVEETGYVTEAEKPVPGFADLDPGSLLFEAPDGPVDLSRHTQWWAWVPGASWRSPEGPGSGLEGRMDHPVVHVSWNDAVAFAEWHGARLPTEAEWEYAARAGSSDRFQWGNRDPEPTDANVWQGPFPEHNEVLDGFSATAPVGQFPANGFGLYDMAGNVWEWTADWYHPRYYATSPASNPAGPSTGTSRVLRGGSFLCHKAYCESYRPTARMHNTPDSGTHHQGFRLVWSRP